MVNQALMDSESEDETEEEAAACIDEKLKGKINQLK